VCVAKISKCLPYNLPMLALTVHDVFVIIMASLSYYQWHHLVHINDVVWLISKAALPFANSGENPASSSFRRRWFSARYRVGHPVGNSTLKESGLRAWLLEGQTATVAQPRRSWLPDPKQTTSFLLSKEDSSGEQRSRGSSRSPWTKC
jgi:hypothetical protein